MTRPKPVTMWALAYRDETSQHAVRICRDRPIVEATAGMVRERAAKEKILSWPELYRLVYRVVKVRVEAV